MKKAHAPEGIRVTDETKFAQVDEIQCDNMGKISTPSFTANIAIFLNDGQSFESWGEFGVNDFEEEHGFVFLVKHPDNYVDVWFDRSIRLWTAILLERGTRFQIGDAIYAKEEKHIIQDAVREWGKIDIFKDTVNFGFNKKMKYFVNK